MNKPAANATLLALALACAGLLVWLWRADRTATRTSFSPAPPVAVAPAAAPVPTAPPGAEARALLAALQQILATRDARAKEAVLTFKDDAALARFVARAKKSGLNIIAQSDALRSVRVRYETPAALRNELAANAADYASLGANTPITIPEPPAKQDRTAVDQVPFRNRTLEYLGVGAAGDTSTWGRGVTVAILDTGVAPDATFGAGRLRALDIGLGTAPGDGSEDGHGTAVAALAAGATKDAAGVAPSASILSIRVTDASGTSDIFTLAHAIVTATDAGAKVINVSLGGYATSNVLESAIGYALDRGALIVAAAGNDQAAQLAWPAADPRVISVGAIDAAEQQVTFSNSGPQLQLTAPGYGVQTAWLGGQRAYVDGTSVSAPLVAGALAAVLSKNPGFTPQQAAQLIAQTASDGGAPGADPAFGRGILNLAWAMNAANSGYVDTAISSHYFDAAGNQMEFVVQNRSGQSVSGMMLDVTVGAITSSQIVPSLAPGESYVVKTPVDDAALRRAGSLVFSTQLKNPIGLDDKVPANNRRTSVLTAPR